MDKKKKNKNSTSDSENDLLTIQEAAQLRGVTKTRIHQWINEGRLNKEIRYGRSLVSKAEMLAIEALPSGRPRKKDKLK